MRHTSTTPSLPRTLTAALVLLILLNCVAGPALAQRATASIAGSIVDASGAAVPGANVLLKNLATGIERSVESNDLGFYTVTALPAGPYSITVAKAGFQTQTVPQLVLEVDQNATLNLTLKVGAVSEAVSVVAEALAVDTRTATLNTVITQKQIADLPLNGRNVFQLMQLTPGTVVATGSFNQIATRPESQLISASGGRGNSTTFVLDGGLHEDPYTEVANSLRIPTRFRNSVFRRTTTRRNSPAVAAAW